MERVERVNGVEKHGKGILIVENTKKDKEKKDLVLLCEAP